MRLNSLTEKLERAWSECKEETCWIYGIYVDEELIYVGSTVYPAGRLRTHLERWPFCVMELFLEVPVSERFRTERLAIRLAENYGWPLKNRVLPRGEGEEDV